jgi:beta-alanine--pyruvate transaminase
VTPDLITCAKGITNGAVPMGAVFASRTIHDAIVDSGSGIELAHGYTYSGHPLGCAAGLATLDVFQSEGLFHQAIDLESYWADAVHSLKMPLVADIRSIGLVAGIEFESREGQSGARAFDVFTRAFDAGILVRHTGETIALSPPLTFTRQNIDELIGRLASVMHEVD